MPWKSSDVPGKTKKARTAAQKRQWTHVANAVLKRLKAKGKAAEGRAIREANAVIADPARRTRKKR